MVTRFIFGLFGIVSVSAIMVLCLSLFVSNKKMRDKRKEEITAECRNNLDAIVLLMNIQTRNYCSTELAIMHGRILIHINRRIDELQAIRDSL
jgi:hypothetical protein